jgi:UDP-N-acetylmuramoylalanine--D-glutamate ligase
MLQTLADAIDAGPAEALRERLPEVWVLELSSFQLDGVNRFEADAAALLNLTEDHLDWHGAMPAYAAAKARVFGKRAVVVVNRDDPAVMKLVPPPETVATKKGRPPRVVPRRVVEFGAGVPERPGDWGLVASNDMAWLVRARDDDASPRELTLQQLMPADALRIRGRHNALNALAALALAHAIGCPLAPMLHALREYRGEPHRVEHVATVDGVDAFDDSKGTNVGATVAALDGLGADRAPKKLVVILGGDGKGQDFAPLAAPLSRHARAVLTIGRDAARIEAAIGPSGIAFERCATLEQAVDAAFAKAERGDAVLLSPACASLDMFRNYAHRAEVFVAAVRPSPSARERSCERAGPLPSAHPAVRSTEGRPVSGFAGVLDGWRARLGLGPVARGATTAGGGRGKRAPAAEPIPVREWISVDPGQPRGCSASTAPSSAWWSACSPSAS